MHTIKQHFSLSCESLVENEALNIALSRGSGEWNEKYCTVVASCKQHSDPLIVLTEHERKDHFEHRAKNQTAVFQSGTFLLQKVETRKGIKLT